MTDPPPTDDELRSAYAAYRPAEGRFMPVGDTFLRWSRGLLAARIDRIAPPGRVLDVGSGDGSLLEALRARGREADGVEPGRSGGSRYDDIAEVSGDWAAVVFWHSLEHLRHPAEAIEQATELLSAGGVLFVAAPNAESIQANLFGGSWLALDLPRHLVHLSPGVLAMRLETLGFTVERVSALRGGQSVFGWLHGLVGLLPGTADLYQAIRRPAARDRAIDAPRRVAALGTAIVLLPVAALAAAGEAAVGVGGSFYVEARRV
jgi:SAM-dependent methyltransferase